LFIYKYGLRQNHISVYIILLIYGLGVSSLLLYKNILQLDFLRKDKLKYLYIAICLLVALIIFTITFFTNGNTLNVDRWSAMDVAIRAFLNGEYPYTAVDHLKGRTSNFPGLLILGIPFYLLGNVGYLQVFAFILLSYTLYKYLNIKEAFRYILLFLISPAYWWEIFAISDLMSNTIIVLCFIIFLKNKLKTNILAYPLFLGFSTSFLVLTRGIFAIPLTLLAFKDFFYSNLKNKFKYLLSFLLTFILLIEIVIMNCPDLETLKHFNPLVLQTHFLPNYVHIIALVLPFYFSFKIKKFKPDFFKITPFLILFPTLLAFIYRWQDVGFEDIIFKNRFDLSYLSIVIPFILIEIVQSENNI
jgi:hypothetical protein